MDAREQIADLELQLEVMRELYSECSSLKQGMNDYLILIHATLADAGVPRGDGLLLTRVQWLIARMQPADDRY